MIRTVIRTVVGANVVCGGGFADGITPFQGYKVFCNNVTQGGAALALGYGITPLRGYALGQVGLRAS